MLYSMWHKSGKSRCVMGGNIKQRGDPPDVRGRSSTTQPDATSIPPLPQCGSSTYTQLARAVLFRIRLWTKWKPKMFARTANFIFAAFGESLNCLAASYLKSNGGFHRLLFIRSSSSSSSTLSVRWELRRCESCIRPRCQMQWNWTEETVKILWHVWLFGRERIYGPTKWNPWEAVPEV